MRLQIGKWGNSLAVRLPAPLTQEANLREGDLVEAEIAPDGTVVITPAHSFDKTAFLSDLDKLHRTLPSSASVIDILRQEERY
jgi:antitoxin MazE